MKNINEKFAIYKKNRKRLTFLPINVDDIKIENSKVVIIVPFRESINDPGTRTKQLDKFTEYYSNSFTSIYKIEKPQILIIEQSNDGRGFNRGALLNIGFELAKKSSPDVYIFHDVDLISAESLVPLYYMKTNYPIHIASLWKEKYNFSTFFGGIVSFDEKSYEKINGFPNSLYGWGS
jgi:hypothetical protein